MNSPGEHEGDLLKPPQQSRFPAPQQPPTAPAWQGELTRRTGRLYHARVRILAALLFTLLPLCAQEKQEKPEKKEEAKPEKVIPAPTRLKILKATTGPEIAQIMKAFTAGLGVQC